MVQVVAPAVPGRPEAMIPRYPARPILTARRANRPVFIAVDSVVCMLPAPIGPNAKPSVAPAADMG